MTHLSRDQVSVSIRKAAPCQFVPRKSGVIDVSHARRWSDAGLGAAEHADAATAAGRSSPLRAEAIVSASLSTCGSALSART